MPADLPTDSGPFVDHVRTTRQLLEDAANLRAQSGEARWQLRAALTQTKQYVSEAWQHLDEARGRLRK